MIIRLKRLYSRAGKTAVLLGVICSNFLFIGVDVLMAHSQNNYFRWALIPVGYSVVAVLAVVTVITFQARTVVRRVFQIAMWLGVLVGVAGTFFHVHGNSMSGQVSFHRLLVEGSPVAAPIAFAGIAAFALVSEHYQEAGRRFRLLVLVGVGFMAAAVAAFLDHARLDFTPGYTMIPILSGTLAAISCFYIAAYKAEATETRIFLSILALSAFVGLAGFVFHVLGDLAGTQDVVWVRFLYRNPILGPLLFCDLALLAGLSILPEPQPVSEDSLDPTETTEVPERQSA